MLSFLFALAGLALAVPASAQQGQTAQTSATLQVRSEKSNQFIRVDSTDRGTLIFWDCQQFDNVVCEPVGREDGYSRVLLEQHMFDLTRKDRVQTQVHQGIRIVSISTAVIAAISLGAGSLRSVRQLFPDRNWPEFMRRGLIVGAGSLVVTSVDELSFLSGTIFYDGSLLDQTLALQQVQRDSGLSGEAKTIVTDKEYESFREALFIALESFERSLISN